MSSTNSPLQHVTYENIIEFYFVSNVFSFFLLLYSGWKEEVDVSLTISAKSFHLSQCPQAFD